MEFRIAASSSMFAWESLLQAQQDGSQHLRQDGILKTHRKQINKKLSLDIQMPPGSVF